MTDRSISIQVLLKDAPPRECTNALDHIGFDVRAVFCDSREAHRHGANGLFVCISGAAFDGHDFARAVYDAGVRTFAVSHTLNLPTDALQLVYDDTRLALAQLSASFYRHPSRELSVVGLTGTKGKTTTALIAYELLKKSGIPTGYIGTSGIRYADRSYASPNTTPESLILQRAMREMCDAGIRVLLMEVSSQALIQHRVHGISFAVTLFTNLSRDHIGPKEHPTFEHYKAAKRSLFTAYQTKRVILNADDAHAADMLPPKDIAVETFSAGEGGMIDAVLPRPALSAAEILPVGREDSVGISFSVHDTERSATLPAFLPLPGACNVHNALAALMIAHALGVPYENAVPLLADVSIEGRCEAIKTGLAAHVFIDYAHNETSLREILTALRAYRPRRLIVLFGSVGGRTEERRATMGAAAAELADLAILTSDNPDREPPERIIADIEKGMPSEFPRIAIPDRREAILYALSALQEGDVLLLAGKGHEAYQLIDGEKRPFSEREIVEKWVFAAQNA